MILYLLLVVIVAASVVALPLYHENIDILWFHAVTNHHHDHEYRISMESSHSKLKDYQITRWGGQLVECNLPSPSYNYQMPLDTCIYDYSASSNSTVPIDPPTSYIITAEYIGDTIKITNTVYYNTNDCVNTTYNYQSSSSTYSSICTNIHQTHHSDGTDDDYIQEESTQLVIFTSKEPPVDDFYGVLINADYVDSSCSNLATGAYVAADSCYNYGMTSYMYVIEYRGNVPSFHVKLYNELNCVSYNVT